MNRLEVTEAVRGRLREFDEMYRRGTGMEKLEAMTKIWVDALMKYSEAANFEEALDMALCDHVRENKFFPMPSEVIARMEYWIKKDPPPPVERVTVEKLNHNAQVAQAIRLAIREKREDRIAGLKKLVELKVLTRETALMYVGRKSVQAAAE